MNTTDTNTVALTFSITSASGTRREVVTAAIIKIGKDAKSQLRLEDERAARMHAVVEVDGLDDITLIDLENEPFTRVNGQPIGKKQIRVGDEIGICDTVLKLEAAEHRR